MSSTSGWRSTVGAHDIGDHPVEKINDDDDEEVQAQRVPLA
jgi:hypothetical protein